MSKRRNTLNQLAVSFILGAIIIAFAFTGVQSFTNNPDHLGDVDGTEITAGEYNRMYNRMLDYYTQINQGKALSQKEIRQRRIGETVFQQLVSQKMILNFATDMHFDAGAQAVKNTIITDYPDFKTAGQFDVKKYKNVLKLNRIQFKDFEDGVIDQIKQNKLNELIGAILPSDNYIADVLKYKNAVAKIQALSFDKEAMTEFISVSNQEIDEFLAQSKSKAIIDSLYQTYQTKEGEKAKTLEQMKKELATSHIQRTKRDDLKKFNEQLKTDLESAFKANQWSQVKKLAKKYNLNFRENTEVNLLDISLPGMKVDEEKINDLVTNKNTTDVIVQDSPLSVSLVKVQSFEQKKEDEKEKEQFLSYAARTAAQAINFKILELQKKKSKVTQSVQL